jgi:hypothetical protein
VEGKERADKRWRERVTKKRRRRFMIKNKRSVGTK